jgi:lipoprotein NlpD
MSRKLLIAAASSALLLAACASSKVAAPVVDRSNAGTRTDAAAVGGPGYHTVKKGETLYSISQQYGREPRDVAAWNNLDNPSLISIGQVLRVQPPEAAGGVVATPVGNGGVEVRALDGGAVALASTSTHKSDPKAGKEPYSEAAYARLQGTTAPTAPASTAVAGNNAVPAAPAAAAVVAGNWHWPANGKVVAGYKDGGNKGVDIAGKAGDPVLASADGKVVYAGSGLPGYGQLIIIKHDATYLTAYAHNQKILVKEGQAVKQDQKIAEMGSTGTDRVKLHFEVRKAGNPVDPMGYLPAR